jgi:hypothetical protein
VSPREANARRRPSVGADTGSTTRAVQPPAAGVATVVEPRFGFDLSRIRIFPGEPPPLDLSQVNAPLPTPDIPIEPAPMVVQRRGLSR